MKHAFISFVPLLWPSLAFAGLDDPLPPEAYVNPIDQQIARTGIGIPGRPFPCSYEEKINGMDVIASSPTELCVKMLRPQRWRGLWRDAFEGSRFCPEPAQACNYKTPGERIWLGNTPGTPRGGLYQIEFVGRRTRFRGPYGHMGLSDHKLIIDRVISMIEVEPPPPLPTRAEVVRRWKECEAAKTCIPDWTEINQLEEAAPDP